MPEIVCLVSERTGKILRALKGDMDIQKGDICLVESELGGDIARVIDIASDICRARKGTQGAVKIIRKATDEDVKKFSWLREKEK